MKKKIFLCLIALSMVSGAILGCGKNYSEDITKLSAYMENKLVEINNEQEYPIEFELSYNKSEGCFQLNATYKDLPMTEQDLASLSMDQRLVIQTPFYLMHRMLRSEMNAQGLDRVPLKTQLLSSGGQSMLVFLNTKVIACIPKEDLATWEQMMGQQ